MRYLVALLVLITLVASSPAMNSLELRLDRQMRFWQKRLGMEEWNVELRIVRQQLLDRDSWGTVEWDPDKRSALISVLDPRDYNLKGSELKLDMECTIVHELLHVHISPLEARDEEVREEIVNKLMTALLNRPCPN
jgi:hypothetical protein